jgi:hypothetical protein
VRRTNIQLLVRVISSCKCSLNPFTKPNPVYSRISRDNMFVGTSAYHYILKRPRICFNVTVITVLLVLEVVSEESFVSSFISLV